MRNGMGRCHGACSTCRKNTVHIIPHWFRLVNAWKLSLCQVAFSEEGQCYNWGLHFSSKDLGNPS